MSKFYFIKCLVFLSIGFSPALVLAQAKCVSLSGTFKCEDAASTRHLNFASGSKNQVPYYVLNNLKLQADGVPSSRSSGSGSPVIYTAFCTEDSYEIQVETSIMSSFCSHPITIKSQTVWTKSSQDLIEDDLTIVQCPGSDPQVIRKQTVCKKVRGFNE